jgi:hypothetical protein
LLINAPPPNEKCLGNESKNYGMYDKHENNSQIATEYKLHVNGLYVINVFSSDFIKKSKTISQDSGDWICWLTKTGYIPTK